MGPRQFVFVGVGLALAVAACGSDEMTLTEYVERVDAILDRGMQQYQELAASPQGEVLVVEGERLADFTPQQLQVALEQVVEIQDEALGAAAAIEPPAQIADLHELFFRKLPIAELAARAGTATDWEELSDSPEMAAYRAGLVGDSQVCDEFQAKLDATEERGAFVDTPWIPSEMKEIVDAAIGCSDIPEHPEDSYRPPPPAIP